MLEKKRWSKSFKMSSKASKRAKQLLPKPLKNSKMTQYPRRKSKSPFHLEKRRAEKSLTK